MSLVEQAAERGPSTRASADSDWSVPKVRPWMSLPARRETYEDTLGVLRPLPAAMRMHEKTRSACDSAGTRGEAPEPRSPPSG